MAGPHKNILYPYLDLCAESRDNSAGKPLRSVVQAPLTEFMVGPDRNIHHQLFAVKVKPQLLNPDPPTIIWKRNGRARNIKSLELSHWDVPSSQSFITSYQSRCIPLHIDAVYGWQVVCPQFHTSSSRVEKTPRIYNNNNNNNNKLKLKGFIVKGLLLYWSQTLSKVTSNKLCSCFFQENVCHEDLPQREGKKSHISGRNLWQQENNLLIATCNQLLQKTTSHMKLL